MSNVKQYRKKPVIIEAILWNGSNITEVLDFGETGPQPLWGDDFKVLKTGKVAIFTLEGTITADTGDYIIRGIQGEFYPCKPDIFLQSYEEVSDLVVKSVNANTGVANPPSDPKRKANTWTATTSPLAYWHF